MQVAPVSADLILKIALIAGVSVGVLYVVKKVRGAAGDALTSAAGAVSGAVSGAVEKVDETVSNVIVGAGGMVGIPATNDDQCSLDLARGDTWAASFSCPASRFIKEGLLDPKSSTGLTGGATGSW